MELRTELDAALEKMIAKPAAAEPSHQPSIAVLPFATMSSDKEQEYFSDGLAEEIGNALARIPGLKVTARTSAFAFRGKEQDIRKIAEALDVRTILEGSVRRSGNRIRVNVQLVQAVDGYRLWSERYDREFADVFEVQDEIAEAITAALKVKFEPAGVRRPTANLDAYEALLKARHFRARLTQESLTKAREYLEQAIALDPNYELAHCELAQYFIDRALYADEMPAHTAMPAARVAAQRTLEINPSNPEAHAALGAIAALYDYDWKAAGHHFNRALAHEPVPPQVYFRHGLFYLLPMGRPAEAAQELARGLKEDPLNIPGRVDYAVSLQAAGRAEESVAQLRQIQALDPNFWFPYFLLGMSHAMSGAFPQARPFAENAYALAPWSAVCVGSFAGVLARSGDRTGVSTLIESLGTGEAYGAPLGLAHYYLICSDIDASAAWFEKAVEQRHPAVLFFRMAFGGALASSPRWPEIAKILNLPAEMKAAPKLSRAESI